MPLTLETTDGKAQTTETESWEQAAFMEASGRVGKDEHRIDGVTEGYQRKLSKKSWHALRPGVATGSCQKGQKISLCIC